MRTRKPKRTPTTWREGRRLRAWQLHQRGWTHTLIAQALGVSEGAVSQWISAAKAQGEDALLATSRHGQGARLSEEQMAQLMVLLKQGPESFGFLGALWTCSRIASVIQQHFGVQHHPAHVSRLLHQQDWTYQKPVLRASQRDEALIAGWLSSVWPEIKKKPKTRAERSYLPTNRASP